MTTNTVSENIFKTTPFNGKLDDKLKVPTQEGPEGILFDFCAGPRVVFPSNSREYSITITDLDSGLNIGRYDSSVSKTFCLDARFFIRTRLDFFHKGEKQAFFTHTFDPRNKHVAIAIPVEALGDNIGLFSYVERFQKKTGCLITMLMAQKFIDLFKGQYPDFEFISLDNVDKMRDDIYALYQLAPFYEKGVLISREDSRLIGNHRVAASLLDVDRTDIPPRVNLSAPRKIKEPYVVIAQHASGFGKMWHHSNGWNEVIQFLHQYGYKVACCDYLDMHFYEHAANVPTLVDINDNGDKPLQERVNLIKDADFFIGLSSGLSWLAWAAKVPVVMISGVTHPVTEFNTPYRVINYLVCNSCWNDLQCKFTPYEEIWCPRHKGTSKECECSKFITPKMVIDTIRKVPAFQKRSGSYLVKNVFENL